MSDDTASLPPPVVQLDTSELETDTGVGADDFDTSWPCFCPACLEKKRT